MADPAGVWAREQLRAMAKEYFPGRARELEGIIRRLVGRHEKVWKSSPPGAYRPTSAMYALALQWELKRLGPNCSVCQKEVAVPARPTARFPTETHLSLAPRLRAVEGGLNVPQNLVLCHAGCRPGM
jgi:transcriptional regulator with GAF, ATPase, and Fis domain